MKKHMSKKLIMAIRIACIGSAVLGIGGMQNVFAYSQDLNPIGYQADGGSIRHTSDTVYVNKDGTVQWQVNGEYAEDTTEKNGNVAIGNFSKAGSLGDYSIGYATVYRESDNGWHDYQGKKYTTEDVSYIKQGDQFYQYAGDDSAGNPLFYELNKQLQKKDESESPVSLPLTSGITNNVAVGNKATTKSSSSVAIGDNSQSQGYRGIAIGAESQTGDTPIVLITMMGFQLLLLVTGPKRWGMGVSPRDKVHTPMDMHP